MCNALRERERERETERDRESIADLCNALIYMIQCIIYFVLCLKMICICLLDFPGFLGLLLFQYVYIDATQI